MPPNSLMLYWDPLIPVCLCRQRTCVLRKLFVVQIAWFRPSKVANQNLKIDFPEVHIENANFSKVSIPNAINWKVQKILYQYKYTYPEYPKMGYRCLQNGLQNGGWVGESRIAEMNKL